MDFWIVVAAAGAGYIAKHRQNLLRNRENSSLLPSGDSNFVKPESPPLMQQLRDTSCRLAETKKIGGVSTEREQVMQGASTAEVDSTCGLDGEKSVNVDNYEDCDTLSISSLLPGFLRNEDLQGDWERIRVSGDMGENSGDLPPEPSTGKMNTSYGFARNRNSLRIRQFNTQFIRPLSSLESCLMAQLYKEHAEMEEYVLSSLLSPSTTTVRPFFVTDGRRIISRARGDSLIMQIGTGENKLEKGTYSAENEPVFGIPPLPNVGSGEFPRKTKVKTGKGWCGKLSSSNRMVNGRQFHSQAGSSHSELLFCLGISVGITSSVLANKREVNKLTELLRQTTSLVQDLQEELEMKDSLTVKELAIEDYESQDTHDSSYNGAPLAFSPQQNLDEPTNCDGKELHDEKAEEHSESMSRIEAELEAELERLELNMNSSSLEGRLSDLVELDPDFIPDIIPDELNADMFGWQAGAQPYTDQDGSGTSTTHSANYAVSPRELSLRLHEIIQSRLEESIKELETALQNSQRKVQFMESECINSWRRELSNSKVGSSSIQGSPIAEEERKHIDQPMVINLSGEALDTYNEACDELMKMHDSEEDDLPSRGEHQEDSLPFDGNLHHTIINGTFIPQKGRTLEEHTIWDDVDTSGDENEKLLIKQIVEETRKGSPAVLNAQRVLYWMDDNENRDETKGGFVVHRHS